MKLRLKGFKGIKASPKLDWSGPDEITVDFTGRDGITAFEGENGSGKTTCIESLSHFPQLISRKGPLWQHCFLRDSVKEFEDDYMGHHYRSEVKIDAQSGQMEGKLYIDGSETSCTNPKITEYVKKLEEIFGNSETYFRARFSPQRSKKTSEKSIDNMTPGAFRDLLREFLGLHRYEAWSKTAKSAGDVLSGKVGALDSRVATLTEVTTKRDEVAFDLDGYRVSTLPTWEDEKTRLLRELAEKRQAADALKDTISRNALAAARRQDIAKQIETLQVQLGKEKTDAEIDIAALGNRWREINGEVGRADAVVQDRERIEQAAVNLEAFKNSESRLTDEIEKMVGELPGYQERVHGLEMEIAALNRTLEALDNDKELQNLTSRDVELQRQYDALKKTVIDIAVDAESNRLIAELSNLNKRAAERDLYDPACISNVCVAIAEASKAKARIPEAEEAINARVEQVKRLNAATQAIIEAHAEDMRASKGRHAERLQWVSDQKRGLQDKLRNLTHDLLNAQQAVLGTNELLTAKRNQLTAMRLEIARQKALADKLPEIQLAEARKQDLGKQLQDVTAQGQAKREAWTKREAALENQMDVLRNQEAEITVDEFADLSLLQIQREIKEIETVKIPEIEKEIQAARDKIATLQAELSKIEAAEKELETVKAEREALTKKISIWRYLQNECGEKGLQAHEISGAAPAIVKNANDLLMSAFDIPYTMRLKTFDEETQRECFNVLIICPDGQEVDLDLISGGQRAWVVQSISLAFSLLKQQSSGQEFDYFCADESDGALDPDNAAKYAALYPSFMKLAKLKSLYFISHQPPARALADHALKFEAGKNPAWR